LTLLELSGDNTPCTPSYYALATPNRNVNTDVLTFNEGIY